MSQEIRYQEMIEKNICACDCEGRRIHRVRSVKVVDGGIEVKVLHQTNQENKPVLGRMDDGKLDVIEFYAFVPGGFLGERLDATSRMAVDAMKETIMRVGLPGYSCQSKE